MENSKRSRAVALASTLAFVVGGITMWAGTARAATVSDPVGGGVFQLEGDAQTGTPANTAGDDWDRVCHQVVEPNDTTDTTKCSTTSNTGATAPATSVAWGVDGGTVGATNASIFTGGGSKDPQDISQWAWKDGAGGLPDKDNLLHAFGARYSVPASSACPNAPTPPYTGNCELLYFGSDRFDNSGDAQQGFWFLQNRVTLGSNSVGGGSGFNGVHKDGDLLVVSDFSNGGGTSTITIYAWDHTVSGNLKALETSNAAKCDPGLPQGTAFCGIVNSANGTVSPWPFLDKSGKTTFLNGEFYEGGINLSLLPGSIASECFASLESETRSSTSTTATLKDFVLTNFGDCNAKLTTQVSGTSVNPTVPVHDVATVKGNRANLTPTGNVTFFLCSFAANSTDLCDKSNAAHTGTQVGANAVALSGSGNTATAQSPDVNTAANPLSPGRYCFRAEWPGDANYTTPLTEFGAPDGSTECFVVLQSSSQTVTDPQLVADGSPIGTNSVVITTPVQDHALITGANGFGTPTGTVNFFICNPTQVTGSAGNETCPSGTGTALTGNPRTATAVSGSNPPQSQATSSPSVVPNLTGVWCFRAVYTPDTLNYTGSSDASHGECFTVVNSQTSTVTQPRLTDGVTAITSPVAVGTQAVDHALVTGANGFGTPTGTVTFFICNPSQVTGTAGNEVCAGGSGTQVGSPVTAVAVANSSPPQSEALSTPAITAGTVGVWCFRAVYTPDTLKYLTSSDATHGECFTVTDTSSGTSQQNWLPNDHAVVSTTGGTALNGTLDISLHEGACDGSTVDYTEPTITLTNTPSGTGFDTHNTTFKVTAANNATPYYWRVVFTSNTPLVSGFTKCEHTDITITD